MEVRHSSTITITITITTDSDSDTNTATNTIIDSETLHFITNYDLFV